MTMSSWLTSPLRRTGTSRSPMPSSMLYTAEGMNTVDSTQKKGQWISGEDDFCMIKWNKVAWRWEGTSGNTINLTFPAIKNFQQASLLTGENNSSWFGSLVKAFIRLYIKLAVCSLPSAETAQLLYLAGDKDESRGWCVRGKKNKSCDAKTF